MATTLILVRHGATPANVQRPYTIQGLQPDSELIEIGLQQAQATAEFLAGYPIVKGYASPLLRARKTAEVIAERVGVSVELVPELVEVDVGLWTGLTWDQVHAKWPAEAQAFREDTSLNGYLGGENLIQVRDRVVPAVDKIIAAHPNETIVIVSHGVVNRVLLVHWMKIPIRMARLLPQDNTGINIVDFHDGLAKVRTINQVVHLDTLTTGTV